MSLFVPQVNSESEENFQATSAFSPLALACAPYHRNFNPHTNRRFLSAPYAGTGYLPTVIRPPIGYPQNSLIHHLSPSSLASDLYSSSACISEKTVTTSPGSASSSEKTTYSEWQYFIKMAYSNERKPQFKRERKRENRFIWYFV